MHTSIHIYLCYTCMRWANGATACQTLHDISQIYRTVFVVEALANSLEGGPRTTRTSSLIWVNDDSTPLGHSGALAGAPRPTPTEHKHSKDSRVELSHS